MTVTTSTPYFALAEEEEKKKKKKKKKKNKTRPSICCHYIIPFPFRHLHIIVLFWLGRRSGGIRRTHGTKDTKWKGQAGG
jgi:hypothetical protein